MADTSADASRDEGSDADTFAEPYHTPYPGTDRQPFAGPDAKPDHGTKPIANEPVALWVTYPGAQYVTNYQANVGSN